MPTPVLWRSRPVCHVWDRAAASRRRFVNLLGIGAREKGGFELLTPGILAQATSQGHRYQNIVRAGDLAGRCPAAAKQRVHRRIASANGSPNIQLHLTGDAAGGLANRRRSSRHCPKAATSTTM